MSAESDGSAGAESHSHSFPALVPDSFPALGTQTQAQSEGLGAVMSMPDSYQSFGSIFDRAGVLDAEAVGSDKVQESASSLESKGTGCAEGALLGKGKTGTLLIIAC